MTSSARSSSYSGAQALFSRINDESRRRRALAENKTIQQVLEESRERCKTLSGFMREAWHVLEPANAFVHGWHLDAISEHLEAVSNGQILRLLINEPPGMMKSLEVGVLWPTWEWGPRNQPHLRTLATSYKESLAKRDNIKARRLVKSDWFQQRWGHQFELMADQDSTVKFENDKTGFRAAMVFSSLTGDRGDRVVIDDPLSVDQAKSDASRQSAEDTFLEAIPNRMVDPKTSVIVMIMQRLHEKDPSGIGLAKDLGYVHLMLPMEFERERCCYTVLQPKHFDAGPPIVARYDGERQVWYPEGRPVPEPRREYVARAAVQTVYRQDKRTREGELLFPERFSKEVVERDKVPLGPYGTAGQNQQRPAPRGGGMFKRAWFGIVLAAPEGTKWARGWDLAATDDPNAAYTAGVKLGRGPDKILYVAHVVREHLEGADVRKLIYNTATQDGADCHIGLPKDPAQAGKVQAADYVAMLQGFRAYAEPQTGSKETRAEPIQAQSHAGNVKLVRGVWNEAFIEEAETFPNGAFKDQIDALATAYARLLARKDFAFGSV